MTRSEVIQLLADKQPQLSYKEMEKIVKAIFDNMSEALANGNRIEIRGFGSFSIRFRPPRLARNPKTGEKVQKPGKYTPYYRPGKELRERVNALAKDFPIKVGDSKSRDQDEE